MSDKILAYKGFDKDFKCRDFQFEVGKTYNHNGDVEVCESGFHSCLNPIDVFGYYPPSNSRFAIVEINDDSKSERDGDDSKIASAEITIKEEISLADFIRASADSIIKNAKKTRKATNTGEWSAATNTGYRSAAEVSGLDSVAIVTGKESKARASYGSWIVLTERDEAYKIKTILAAQAGVTEGVKPDVWYVLRGGKFIEVQE